MAIKAYYDTEKDVPEALKEFYVKGEDGKYHLDAEGVEDVTALKKALEAERKLNKGKPGDKLTAEEKTELEELRQKAKDAEENDLRRKGEYDKLEKRLHEDYGKKLTSEQKKVKDESEKAESIKKSLNRVLTENAATQAISKHKGRIAPLLPHVSNRLTVSEKDGKFEVQVVDSSGEVRYSIKDPKKLMSVEELIEADFLTNEDFQGVFEGRGHSGGGMPSGGKSGSGGAITITKEQAKDNRQYRAAKEQADKAGVTLQVATS